MTSPDEINATIRYALYDVFATSAPLPTDPQARAVIVADAERALATTGVTVRGYYDVSATRANTDLLVWLHGESVEQVQAAHHALLASALGRHLSGTWSAMGMHRAAEFNKSHVPAFMAGIEPKRYLSLYPFVRSYEWFLLDPAERSRMLREHGQAASPYRDVLANTLSSFGLGDYEFLLAFEADEMHRIVDLMRDLRATDARLHVREETPFHVGTRVSLAEWANLQPRG